MTYEEIHDLCSYMNDVSAYDFDDESLECNGWEYCCNMWNELYPDFYIPESIQMPNYNTLHSGNI